VFAEHIKTVVDGVDGGIGGLIMGLDGIAVDQYVGSGQSFDVNTIGMEFSFILTQVRKAGEILEIGGVNEFVVRSEGVTLMIRMLTDEYFLAIVLGKSASFGKTRFLMRLAESKLRAEL
jgi:predicted regulator of Ras-like GTPase activity (Roadblock/LC7/MglB family)